MRAHLLVLSLALFQATAVRAQWTPELAHELSVSAALGAGWYQWAVHQYPTGAVDSSMYGMDATFGISARWGVSTAAPGLALILALQGDLLSMSDQVERYLLSDGAGMFGVRIPLWPNYGQLTLASLFGLAFTNLGVQGPGLTYGACVLYRLEHYFVETRYQAFAFTMHTAAPESERTDVTIHQLLANVGVAL